MKSRENSLKESLEESMRTSRKESMRGGPGKICEVIPAEFPKEIPKNLAVTPGKIIAKLVLRRIPEIMLAVIQGENDDS